MDGYMGKVLKVNLSSGRITKEPLDMEFTRKYIGGRGFNSRILYDSIKPSIDPLGPDNIVIISSGPCCGTEVPGGSRFTVTTKSPLSGILGDANSGASFGAQLKYAGYDTLIIEGQAKNPVYLWIDDDDIELRPAGHLWGRTTRETNREIIREVGDPDIGVITIGIGGENRVRFACIIADLGRGIGRSGIGAVFGSKKLKAVAASGSKGVKVAYPQDLAQAAKEYREAWERRLSVLEERAKYGPFAGWRRYRDFGMIPTRNFQQGTFDEWKLMEQDWDDYFFKQKACFSCPAGCDHLWVISEGPYAGTFGEGPELTVPGDFGPRVGNSDLGLALKAATVCDEYGIDYFDVAGAIGYAMECFQRGILTEKDTGGLKLEWGSADAILGLIEMIARREGIGDVLSQGLPRASKAIGRGSEKYALHVKGLAMVMRNVRASKGWGLGFAVSARGACHVRAHPPETYTEEHWDSAIRPILNKYQDPTNPLTEEGKADIVKWYEDLHAFKNSMEICIFSLYSWMFSMPWMLAKFYNSVVGSHIDEAELMSIGERIVNVERAFNLREGLTRRDDSLPDRMLKEPLPDGPAKGQVINLEPMVSEYYELREWGRDSGLPTRKKLSELGLEAIADDLEKIGRLAESHI